MTTDVLVAARCALRAGSTTSTAPKWVRQKSVLAARRQHDEDEQTASAAGGQGVRLLAAVRHF